MAAADRRDLVEVLKAELAFLEAGGYREKAKASWRRQFIFEDSPICLNSRAAVRRRPCTECALMDLVPTNCRHEDAPCRHIRLNEEGETLDSLYRTGTADEIEAAVAKWLKAEVDELGKAKQGLG